jgi:hypothetical protein
MLEASMQPNAVECIIADEALCRQDESAMPATPVIRCEEPCEPNEQSVLGLVELLLKRPAQVDQLNRQSRWQRELFPRFLWIAEGGYLGYGVVMALLLNLAPASAQPHNLGLPLPPASWSDGTALAVPLAYAAGIVLAACVCLPSFYFYCLLAGVRMSWLQITSVVGKGTAASVVLLFGVLPIYVAAVLGLIVFKAPVEYLQWALALGLLLPFIVGPWGLRAIYAGVVALSEQLSPEWQCKRRCLLRRLTLSWTAVYTAVVPIMIYRLWELFAGLV